MYNLKLSPATELSKNFSGYFSPLGGLVERPINERFDGSQSIGLLAVQSPEGAASPWKSCRRQSKLLSFTTLSTNCCAQHCVYQSV